MSYFSLKQKPSGSDEIFQQPQNNFPGPELRRRSSRRLIYRAADQITKNIIYLDGDVLVERLGRVDALDGRVRPAVLDGRAAVQDHLVERAQHVVAVEHVLAGDAVHQRQVIVVLAGPVVAVLPDVQVGRPGRDAQHLRVAVRRAAVVRAGHLLAAGIIAAAHAAQVQLAVRAQRVVAARLFAHTVYAYVVLVRGARRTVHHLLL